jgi:hypothetical protein
MPLPIPGAAVRQGSTIAATTSPNTYSTPSAVEPYSLQDSTTRCMIGQLYFGATGSRCNGCKAGLRRLVFSRLRPNATKKVKSGMRQVIAL